MLFLKSSFPQCFLLHFTLDCFIQIISFFFTLAFSVSLSLSLPLCLFFSVLFLYLSFFRSISLTASLCLCASLFYFKMKHYFTLYNVLNKNYLITCFNQTFEEGLAISRGIFGGYLMYGVHICRYLSAGFAT